MIKIISSSLIILLFFFISIGNSKTIKNIEITGNQRISDQTIIMFSGAEINSNTDNLNINQILKDLYNSNFLKMFL